MEIEVEVDLERLFREADKVVLVTIPILEHDAHICRTCGKVYKHANSLRYHCNLKHPENGNEVKCSICNNTYTSLICLQRHMRSIHTLRCKVCYKTYRSLDLLEQHSVDCTDTKALCHFCGKLYKSKLTLVMHIKRKHADNNCNYKCALCLQAFLTMKGLVNHTVFMHRPKDPATLTRYVENALAGEEHFCVMCDERFANYTQLASHFIRDHYVPENDGVIVSILNNN